MVNLLIYIAMGISSVAVLVALIRFVKGPERVDRIVAVDVVSTIGITLILLLSVIMKREIYIDVAIVYAILGFLGIIVVSRFIKRGM